MLSSTIIVVCLARVELVSTLLFTKEEIQGPAGGSAQSPGCVPLDATRQRQNAVSRMKVLEKLLLSNGVGLRAPTRHVGLDRKMRNSNVRGNALKALAMKQQDDSKEGAALWFRCDLRLDDQLALQAAVDSSAKTLLPIYVFDPAKFRTPTMAGSMKSSARRARFLLESVACLRRELEKRGSGLVVGLGSAPDVIQRFCTNCDNVYVGQGVCSEESGEEANVERLLSWRNKKFKLNRIWGGTLFMPSECGGDPKSIPLQFTAFRQKAESKGRIRNPVAAPKRLPSMPEFEDAELRQDFEAALRYLPSLEDLGYSSSEVKQAMQDDPRMVMPFAGGEEAALQRLQKWMFDDDRLKEYFDIRNGMLGEGYSSKLSPWLALGCISPRRVCTEISRYEKERVKNKSTYWLLFELIWRDFFIYMAHSYGNKLFLPGGITGKQTDWRGTGKALALWKEGRTGDKLVDANMRELLATGFMSNRGRQNVASYLIFDMGVDWRYGAAHFEELLLDYDPCSNWGNWVAAAGLTGGRINRFNTKKQLSQYDPEGEYVNCWVPGSSVAGEQSNSKKPTQDKKRTSASKSKTRQIKRNQY